MMNSDRVQVAVSVLATIGTPAPGTPREVLDLRLVAAKVITDFLQETQHAAPSTDH